MRHYMATTIVVVFICLLCSYLVTPYGFSCPANDNTCRQTCQSENTTLIVAADSTNMYLINPRYGEQVSTVSLRTELAALSGTLFFDPDSGLIYYFGNGMLYHLKLLSTRVTQDTEVNLLSLPTDSIVHVSYEHPARKMIVLYMNVVVWRRVINFTDETISEPMDVPDYFSYDNYGERLVTRYGSSYYIVLRSADRTINLVKLDDNGNYQIITTLSTVPDSIFFFNDILYRVDGSKVSYFDSSSWIELLTLASTFSTSTKHETKDIIAIVDSTSNQMLYLHDRSIPIHQYNVSSFYSIYNGKRIMGHWNPLLTATSPKEMPTHTLTTTNLIGDNLMFGTNFTYTSVLYSDVSPSPVRFPLSLCSESLCFKGIINGSLITPSNSSMLVTVLYSATTAESKLCSSVALRIYNDRIDSISPTSVLSGSLVDIQLAYISSSRIKYKCLFHVIPQNRTFEVDAMNVDPISRNIQCSVPNLDSFCPQKILVHVEVATSEYTNKLSNSGLFFLRYILERSTIFEASFDSLNSVSSVFRDTIPDTSSLGIEYIPSSQTSPRSCIRLFSNHDSTYEPRRYVETRSTYSISETQTFLDFKVSNEVNVDSGDMMELSLVAQSASLTISTKLTKAPNGTIFSIVIVLNNVIMSREQWCDFSMNKFYSLKLRVSHMNLSLSGDQYWRVESTLHDEELESSVTIRYDIEERNINSFRDKIYNSEFSIEIGQSSTSAGYLESFIDRIGLEIIPTLNITFPERMDNSLSPRMRLVAIIVPSVMGPIFIGIILAILIISTILFVRKRKGETPEKFSWEQDLNTSTHTTVSGRLYRTYEPHQLQRRIDYVGTLYRNNPTSLTDIITTDETYEPSSIITASSTSDSILYRIV